MSSGNEGAWYLREHRERLGLSQDQLATRAGITKGEISNLENKRPYRQRHIQILADALEIEDYELLMDPTDPDGPWAMLDALRHAPRDRVADFRRIAGALAERPTEPAKPAKTRRR